MKDREIVELEFDSWYKFEDSDELEDYEWIEGRQKSFDSEKGSCELIEILRRRSDNKFFKAEHIRWGAGGNEWNGKLIEVFPKQVTTTIYE